MGYYCGICGTKNADTHCDTCGQDLAPEPVRADKEGDGKWHRFADLYRVACETSQPKAWMEAALEAQRIRSDEPSRVTNDQEGFTPRTDAVAALWGGGDASAREHIRRLVLHAQQLETELTTSLSYNNRVAGASSARTVTDGMVEQALAAANGAMVDTRRHWTEGDRAAVKAMLEAVIR